MPNPPARILVAEDHEINAQYLALLLKRLGLDADIARNGREAVDRVREQGYAAVLMDLYMPELDGLGATREIRALPCTAGLTPVVLVSAENAEDIEGLTPDLRITAMAAKPLREAELRAALAACGVHLAERIQGDERSPVSKKLPADVPADAAPTLPLVDEAAYRRAVSLMPPELRDQLLHELFDATHGAVNLLRTALLGDSIAPVGPTAHKLKGSAMMLGLKRLQDVCTRIEDGARVLQRPANDALRAELAATLQATREALNALR